MFLNGMTRKEYIDFLNDELNQAQDRVTELYSLLDDCREHEIDSINDEIREAKAWENWIHIELIEQNVGEDG